MLGTLELRPLPFKCDMAGPIKAPPICALQRRIWSFCIKGCIGIYTRNPKIGEPLWGGVRLILVIHPSPTCYPIQKLVRDRPEIFELSRWHFNSLKDIGTDADRPMTSL